jgi:hypothetical protein
MTDGRRVTITPAEYEAMDERERGEIKSYEYHYHPGDAERLTAHLEALLQLREETCVPVSIGEFIGRLNAPFMATAKNPQQDMLRIAPEAARAMLTRGDSPVYRLKVNGPAPLAAVDAVKADLWRSGEFAVCRRDIFALEKWAERTASDALSRSVRGKAKDLTEL